MKFKILITLLMTFLIVQLTYSQPPQPVSEPVGDNGLVDWSSHVLQAKGIAVQGGVGGRAGQIRAAELDALRQILETAKGMRLTSETTVENFMLSSDVIRTRVEGVARNFRRKGDPVYMSDGSIELTVEMNLAGSGQFFDAVYPLQMGNMNPIYTTQPQQSSWVFSGLIVDARGLGVRPAISPRILTEDGREVYGSGYANREWAIEYGMAGYAKDLEAAKLDERVGQNPLIVDATKVTGSNRTDVVIADRDVRRIHTVEKNLKFLEECRVIILVD